MNRVIAFLVLLSIFGFVGAEQYPSLAEMNDRLIPIYKRLVKSNVPSELVGEKLKLTLSLRYASEKIILFNGTRVIVDSETKYYLIKWKFDPQRIKELFGKSNIKCKIEGTIIEVVKDQISPGMPYLIVEVDSVQL